MVAPVNICIIDDDDIYQFTVVKTLELLKFKKKIISFYDGEEAMEFIMNHHNEKKKLPDVIFLDINMPVMDGFQFMEAYSEIKSTLAKKTIIYMVSSSVDPVDIEKVEKLNDVSDYVVKPIAPSELKKIMENMLGEHLK
ncbi:response regulator [Algibacter miyuki]|uniref:Response regulator n=1 Tax=Algibacter miyuki TaxID=1306933 RepID=A0ABV5H3F7_9FLAO|nr:response regulator [Algibacter miyuki]MDN3665482.1 response regulator [Algibacter miyuki]